VAIVIEPLENGPYLVKNLESLSNSKGAELPTKEVPALCRCGQSKNKPFSGYRTWYRVSGEAAPGTLPLLCLPARCSSTS
jgi:hypothetical protein